MGVDRIILLIAIIGVVENQAAPHDSSGSTCADFSGKYLFVLTPAANQSYLLKDLLKFTQSAIVVERPRIEGDPVQVVISPKDVTEFEKKSRALKVYRSHSLQCADRTTNLAIVETNTTRDALPPSKLSGKTNENSSLELTTAPLPKTKKKLDAKMCGTSNVCEPEFQKNLTNASLSNDVNKSLESTAPLSTVFDEQLSSRIVRASKNKKGTLRRKSKVKSATISPRGKTRAKPKDKKKSAKENYGKKSAKKVMKADRAYKKTSLIPAHEKSTDESWNKLISMAEKSLTNSNKSQRKSKPRNKVTRSSPIVIRKLLSSTKPANAKKSANTKKISSNQAKRLKMTKMRKPPAKMSTSAKKQKESLNARKRINQRRKSLLKSQGRKKPSSAVNLKSRTKIGSKHSKRKRPSRELKISAETETACIEDNSGKRSLGHTAKRAFSFRAPGCTVIKISNSCDGDCSENNEHNTIDYSNQIYQLSPHPGQLLFTPLNTPAVPIADVNIDRGNMLDNPSHHIPPFVSASSTQSPPSLIVPRPGIYENIFGTPQNYPGPFEFPKPIEEVVEDVNEYDEDYENDYDVGDDEEQNYEEFEGYEKEIESEVPVMATTISPLLIKPEDSFLVPSWNDINIDGTGDSKDEDVYEDEEDGGEIEDYEDMDDDYDHMDDNYDEDDEKYMEEIGKAAIGDDDDYDEDED